MKIRRSILRGSGALGWLLAASLFAGAAEFEALQAESRLVNSRNETVGRAQLRETNSGVLIHLALDKLPAGDYALHIHERGKFTPPDFKAAGGHFNPAGKAHGFFNPQGPHAGDLPNLHVGEDQTLEVELLAPGCTLAAGASHSLLRPGGTSLILHAQPDDYRTEPAGNAGDRIAGGIIQAVKK